MHLVEICHPMRRYTIRDDTSVQPSVYTRADAPFCLTASNEPTRSESDPGNSARLGTRSAPGTFTGTPGGNAGCCCEGACCCSCCTGAGAGASMDIGGRGETDNPDDGRANGGCCCMSGDGAGGRDVCVGCASTCCSVYQWG